MLKLYYPRAIYGVDRDGDPISYNAIGNIDFRGGCCLHVMQHVVFDRAVQEVVVGGVCVGQVCWGCCTVWCSSRNQCGR